MCGARSSINHNQADRDDEALFGCPGRGPHQVEVWGARGLTSAHLLRERPRARRALRLLRLENPAALHAAFRGGQAQEAAVDPEAAARPVRVTTEELGSQISKSAPDKVDYM